jgi:hypothetical protein
VNSTEIKVSCGISRTLLPSRRDSTKHAPLLVTKKEAWP